MIFTIPITLARRIATIPGWLEQLVTFDCAIFDEIDTYLSVDDSAERRDTFPALQRCLDARVSVIGFTGTNLDGRQAKEWARRSFAVLKADVPRRPPGAVSPSRPSSADLSSILSPSRYARGNASQLPNDDGDRWAIWVRPQVDHVAVASGFTGGLPGL